MSTIATVLNYIERVYSKGNIDYTISKYVNRDYWIEDVKKKFKIYNVENLTDFNYSKCFTICINISQTDAHVGTLDFDEYIKKFGVLYRLQLQISVLAPYATFKYIKYECENDNINYSESYLPFVNQHSLIGNKVMEFLDAYNVKTLDEHILSTEVKGIVLELREENTTVYHYLFEDGY